MEDCSRKKSQAGKYNENKLHMLVIKWQFKWSDKNYFNEVLNEQGYLTMFFFLVCYISYSESVV